MSYERFVAEDCNRLRKCAEWLAEQVDINDPEFRAVWAYGCVMSTLREKRRQLAGMCAPWFTTEEATCKA